MWKGPFRIEDLLRDALAQELPRPPEHNGVCVVSDFAWNGEPSTIARVLYVGTTTGKSRRFRTRIGDLIADMFGFYGEETGHHSGGQSLHEYCQVNDVHPFDLWIGWLPEVANRRDSECHFYGTLKPLLNKRQPSDSQGIYD